MDAAHLVVGADSLVGGELLRTLERRGHSALGTTRRPERVGAGRVYLELDDQESELPAIEHAFLVAAQTSYERCESDPATWHTNVESIPRLAGRLLESGAFVTLVSTNAVFGGERPWPGEYDEPEPAIAYARQKAMCEAIVARAAERSGAKDRLAIVRLTKVMSVRTSPIPGWFAAWRSGESIEAFEDLVFAPISVGYAACSLAKLGEKRLSGVFHVSGEENVTYVEFAQALADRLGLWSAVRATTAKERGVTIAFKPRFSGIAMQRTTALTGIVPQSLATVVAELCRQFEAVH